jgi:molecular chaperone DnaK (HSP70)
MIKDEQRSARFIVGIDLGTTNSAVAFVDTSVPQGKVQVFPVIQFVAAGETEARETLPSFHYAPAPGEFGAMRLPWETGNSTHVVGVLARDHGASVPNRLIVSAKSWLSHSGVDRTANLLPWHGAPDVEKLSSTEVSSRYLRHIRDAWNHRWPEHPLEQQEVVITIPASFDEIARELTITAAQRAGLNRIILLEEPQAAFYAWIQARGLDWETRLKPGQKILVCDVGGGTTDLTLIQVRPGERGEVRFHRFAVGDHLILGGDNLDLALAHFIEERLTRGGKLEPRQWSILVRRCQQVKESLLGTAPPERLTVSVPAGGSRLIGGSMNVELTHREVADLLVDGFLPYVALDEKPAKRSSGFQEFGLPYAPDHAITRYLAAFLTAHRHALESGMAQSNHDPARPDIVLLNGGLFESSQMRTRLIEVLSSWFKADDGGPAWKPLVLENQRLDLAVAVGAAYYGLVRRGLGVRISGGLARSYYIGVKNEERNLALCLVPAGLEEGQEIRVEKQFSLLIRQPVEFPLFVSSSRTMDKPGELVEVDASQLTPLPPIRTVLRAGSKSAAAEAVSVRLHARLTEIGTLEVWCAEVDGPRNWRLQFDVRAATQTDLDVHKGLGERAGFVDEQVTQHCRDLIQKTFEHVGEPVLPEQLIRRMEEETGMTRLEWPPSLLRRLWDELLKVEPGRGKSVSHEARWLNLLGFSLRPGFGVAVDDWRVAQTWKISKVQHASNELCRAEWWILWRRVAGGLVPGQQRILADPLIAVLRARARAGKAGNRAKVSGTGDFKFGPHESQEVWRLLGSFELLSPEVKTELGELLMEQLGRKGPRLWGGAAIWALGRIGARVPMYGPLNGLVPVEIVERWIDVLASIPEADKELWFAIMQMARRTNDRYRDISEATRDRLITRMAGHHAPAHYLKLVRDGGELEREEQDLVFGESLPQGLWVASIS